jgi:hypothetical protein
MIQISEKRILMAILLASLLSGCGQPELNPISSNGATEDAIRSTQNKISKIAIDKLVWIKYIDSINISTPEIEYPEGFDIDPRSFTGDLKWNLLLASKDLGVEIKASGYGHINPVYMDRGFASPRDVILIEEVQLASRYLICNGYEIVIEEGKTHLLAVYIQKNSKWGGCFNTLSIMFPDGKLDEYRPIFDRIIQSFKPSYIRAAE